MRKDRLELVIGTARTFQFGWLGRRFVAVKDLYSTQIKDTKSTSMLVLSSRTFDLEFGIHIGRATGIVVVCDSKVMISVASKETDEFVGVVEFGIYARAKARRGGTLSRLLT